MALSRPGAAVNQFSVLMAPDENAKLVVKPNPDFAYATLFYDLTDGPIHILGAMPDSIYWSVALYQENTVNFYVKNDMQYDSDTLNIIISDDAMDQEADIEQIVSPEKTGFVLIRVLVAERDEAHQKAISDYLNALQIP